MPPVITTQPLDTIVGLTDDTTAVSLTCEADGATSYHWERQNSSITSGAIGINTNTITITNLRLEDTGNYRCIATNASGSTPSNYAMISVNGECSKHSLFVELFIEINDSAYRQ